MRIRLIIICLLLVATAGCTNPQDNDPSSTELRSMIKEELRSPEGRQLIQEATSEEELRPMMRELLQSPEGQQEMIKTLETVMESPDVKQQLQDLIEEAIQSPDTQQVVGEVVSDQLLEIIRNGVDSMGQG